MTLKLSDLEQNLVVAGVEVPKPVARNDNVVSTGFPVVRSDCGRKWLYK